MLKKQLDAETIAAQQKLLELRKSEEKTRKELADWEMRLNERERQLKIREEQINHQRNSSLINL